MTITRIMDLGGIKRLPIEPYEIEIDTGVDCPSCGKRLVFDATGDSMNYGEPLDAELECNHCGELSPFTIKIKYKAKVEFKFDVYKEE